MATVNVYLTFKGNCEAAFKFYKSVFGGEFLFMGTFGEMPPQPGQPELPEDVKKMIMHVHFPISKETALYGSDSDESLGHVPTAGNNFSISINTESKEEADRLFNGLSDGGMITMPMADTFWGAYFGMFTDKFGINWMVNQDKQQG